MELFDIVDENGIPTGDVVERSDAHRRDVMHRTAHVWVVRREKGRAQVLLQKRSADKESFPGCYDTSSAGHIHAGDDPLPSALRELEEELGIRASASELSFAGTFRSHYEKVFYDEPFRDNEVTFVYIYDKPVDADRLSLQEDEVESVKWFDIDYLIEVMGPPRDVRFCVPPGGFEIIRNWIRDHM